MPVSVLHVDDEPPFLELAERSYARLDDSIALTTATTAIEATALLDEQVFDCVVCDYVTAPDGTAFVETVHDRCPNTPLILVSGKTIEELPEQSVRAYLTDYVQKGSHNPFETLVGRIDRHTAEGLSSVMRHSFLAGTESGSTSIWTIDMRDGPTMGILAIIATLRDCDIVDLPPLFDAIDADALEAIFAAVSPLDYPGIELRFPYDGFDILVSNDGTVLVRDLRFI